MLNMYKALGHNQFEFARWSPEHYLRYKIIRVEAIREQEIRFSTVLQNIITQAGSVLVRTAWAFPYAPRQHLNFRDKWWEITNVAEITADVNPQTMGLFKSGCTQYVLEILEADGYDTDPEAERDMRGSTDNDA